MSKLDQQIQKLENQRLSLEKNLHDLKRQRNEDILKVLEAFPEGSVSSKTMIGILLDGMDVAIKDTKKEEVWRQAGETFCKKNTRKRSPKKARPSLKKTAPDVSENE